MVAHPSWNLASWAQHWAAHGNCELQFLFQPFQRSNLSNIVRISTIEHDRFFSTYLRALQRLYNLQYTASPSVSCKLYPSMCSAPSLEAFVRRQLLITLRRLIHPSLFSQSYPDWPGSLGFANNTLVLVLYSTAVVAASSCRFVLVGCSAVPENVVWRRGRRRQLPSNSLHSPGTGGQMVLEFHYFFFLSGDPFKYRGENQNVEVRYETRNDQRDRVKTGQQLVTLDPRTGEKLVIV